jgi:hypothetical protein
MVTEKPASSRELARLINSGLLIVHSRNFIGEHLITAEAAYHCWLIVRSRARTFLPLLAKTIALSMCVHTAVKTEYDRC